jgi:hypothetical protein
MPLIPAPRLHLFRYVYCKTIDLCAVLSSSRRRSPIHRPFAEFALTPSIFHFFYQQEVYNYTFKKAFLSDSGTYPLIVVLSVASFIIVGMSANGVTSYKNFRVTPSHKHEVIQEWGTEQKDTMTKLLAKRPLTPYAQEFKAITKEGLGINHEEWKKGKEAYRRGE